MKGFPVQIPITLTVFTGLDPEKQSEPERLQFAAIECLFICESLFWIITQLGNLGQFDHWVFDVNKFTEALERIGTLGEGLSEQVEVLVQHLYHQIPEEQTVRSE